ncbi:FliM/FliN family flagellar motor switch protein [Novosphingobium sp.]|uniref:FliM/FliN family flagellar motor switch protein n=1 Tax=Novosphingobium sp. TaxID=1874826 RepID=UPI00286BBD55|nr:FliM/FliN family flagellar motor switch protein [Novosphingobium sp.]
MKSAPAFVAERAAAQHCAELLRRGPEPADLLPALARAGERFARALAPALADLIGGDAPTVTALAAGELRENELAQELGALAANSLLAPSAPGVTLLASIDGGAVLRLVDRAYGGKGDAAGPLPAQFPLSAELLIARLEAVIAACLGLALGEGPLRALKRNPRIAELAPFPAGAPLAVLPIEVMEGKRAPWKLRLVLPLAALPKVLGGSGGSGPGRAPRPADPAAAPFSEVPLSLVATLVDMNVPLSAIAALEPGAVLPVAVARAVPLSIGGAVIARGSIGAQDDLVAIRLTQIAV